VSARKRKEPAAAIYVVYVLVQANGSPVEACLTREAARKLRNELAEIGRHYVIRRCTVVETRRVGGGA
jgi:hypothetical protein